MTSINYNHTRRGEIESCGRADFLRRSPNSTLYCLRSSLLNMYRRSKWALANSPDFSLLQTIRFNLKFKNLKIKKTTTKWMYANFGNGPVVLSVAGQISNIATAADITTSESIKYFDIYT